METLNLNQATGEILFPAAFAGQIKLVQKDEYLTIYECSTPNGFIQWIKVQGKAQPWGNHYHTKKKELFFLLKGLGWLCLKKVNRKQQASPETKNIPLRSGAVIQVPEFTVHTFLLRPNSEMFCFSCKSYNKQGGDTYPFSLDKHLPDLILL